MFKNKLLISLIIGVFLGFWFTNYIFIPIYNKSLIVEEKIKDISISKESYSNSYSIKGDRPAIGFVEIIAYKKIEITTDSNKDFFLYLPDNEVSELKDKKEIKYINNEKIKVIITLSILLLLSLAMFIFIKVLFIKYVSMFMLGFFITDLLVASFIINPDVMILLLS